MISKNSHLFLSLGIASLALCFHGCESVESQTPPHSTVKTTTALGAAMVLDNGGKGRTTGRGVGQSMAPLYGQNAIVVTNPIAFEDLQTGMIVVYRNTAGHNVVHTLTQKKGSYWQAEGINNGYSDREAVSPHNLIGVVYATFHTQ